MNRVLLILVNSLITVLNIYSYMIVASALLSWFVKPTNRFYALLRSLTAPVIFPFRRIAQKIAGKSGLPIDLSPMLAYFTLQIMIALLYRVLSSIPLY